jgi:hypothetical protein
MSVYLLDTPASYYFRIKVPKDLRSVIQKREIKPRQQNTDSTCQI